MRPAITNFDREAVRVLALRSRVAQAFAGITAAPRRAEHDRWKTLRPTGEGAAMTLSQQGEQLVAEVALAATLTHHEQDPGTATPPVPSKRDKSALPQTEHPIPDAFIPEDLRIFMGQ